MAPASGGLPDGSRVGRVAIDVADPEQTAAFYDSVLGLTVLEQDEDGVVLGAGEAELLVLRSASDVGDRPADAAGLYHTAFRVPDRGDLGDALGRLEAGGHLDGASDHHVSEALYATDPGGNGIEVYHDRPVGEWPLTPDGQVRMETLPLELGSIREAANGHTTLPDGTDVGHVHLEVTSLSTARAFYVDVLGLNVRQVYGEAALFLAAGDYHHHVAVNVWNDRSAPAAGRGLAWFEIEVPGADALEAVRDRLATADRAVSTVGDAIAVPDPDGIEVRLRSVE